MSEHKEPPEDPKNEFSSAAIGDEEPEKGEVRAASFRETEREQANRQDQKEKDEAQASGENNDEFAAQNSGQGDALDQGLLDVKNLWTHKIQDKGDYLSLKGNGPKDQRTGKPSITEKQLEMLVMTSVLNKGWSEIAIYRGNKIDSELTSRAQMMLATNAGLQEALRARGVETQINFQQVLTEKPPPWIKSGMGQQNHLGRLREQTLRMNKSSINALKETEKRAGNFGDNAEGKALKENLETKIHDLKDERKVLKSTLPRGWLGNRVFGKSSAGAATEGPATEETASSEKPANPAGPGTGQPV